MPQAYARRVHLETLTAFAHRLDVEYLDPESFAHSVQIPLPVAEATFKRALAEDRIQHVDADVYRLD